jgi:hypothetical protein
MKRGNGNSAGREGPEWPSRATNRPKTSAATVQGVAFVRGEERFSLGRVDLIDSSRR